VSVKRAALYARVSTNGKHQDPEVQLHALREVAERAHWEVVATYVDRGVSGAKKREKRPAFDELAKDAVRRKFDLIAAWSVDRLGRSLLDLLTFLAEIHKVGVDLYLHQQGLDTTTPMGKMMFQVAGAFAEHERELIRERVNAGLARARAESPQQRHDKHKKPFGRPSLARENPKLLQKIRERVGAGETRRAVAKSLNVKLSTVIKYTRAMPPGHSIRKVLAAKN
jgi:DNA invertase Pin-like site-specific DNA recombinase